MPRPIRFDFDGDVLSFNMQKVDRSKLYGFKQLEVFDEQENQCDLATLAEDGKTLVGKGGTGIGHLTADGLWSDKDQQKPVNLEGDEITPVPSSFAAPVELKQETTIDDYLNHNVRLVYRLKAEEKSKSEDALVQQLKGGAILKFPYSYRGGLEADIGFLLMNESDEIFFLVADPTQVAFVGLTQSPASQVDDDEQPDASDLMDFGMI